MMAVQKSERYLSLRGLSSESPLFLRTWTPVGSKIRQRLPPVDLCAHLIPFLDERTQSGPCGVQTLLLPTLPHSVRSSRFCVSPYVCVYAPMYVFMSVSVRVCRCVCVRVLLCTRAWKWFDGLERYLNELNCLEHMRVGVRWLVWSTVSVNDERRCIGGRRRRCTTCLVGSWFDDVYHGNLIVQSDADHVLRVDSVWQQQKHISSIIIWLRS